MKKKSFTLVEIMIVVAIIAILAAIAVPALGKNRDAAMEQTKQANVKMVNSAIISFLAANPGESATTVSEADICSQLINPQTGTVPTSLKYLDVGGKELKYTAAVAAVKDAQGKVTKAAVDAIVKYDN